jgi:CHASE3 domain sensor protein
MDNFDNTVQKAKDAFDIVFKKTEDLVNVGKQRLNLANLNNKLNKAYASLGKLQFELIKDLDNENSAVASYVSEIKKLKSDIKNLMDEIDSAEGKITCSKCNAKSPAKSLFCSNCGERL